MAGMYFEEFEVGQEFRHALTRTVTFSPDAPAKEFWLMLPGSYAYGKVSPEPAFACDNMLCFPADAVKPGASVTVRVEGARRLGE